MKTKVASYLGTLKFDKSLLSSFQAKYLSNVRVPILLILMTILVGVVAFATIPRRLNPEIKIPIVVVSTVLPGASPDDVEQLLTIPLEKQLKGVEGIDTMNSQSRESVSVITLQFVSSREVKDAESDVQALVDRLSTLPDDAMNPNVISVDFENQPFWTFAISTNADTASLMRFSKELEAKVEQVATVDHVDTSGLDEQVVEVVVDQARAREYNISPLQISGMLQSAAKSFPAGLVNSSASVFSLTINRQINSIEDIRNLEIKNGDAILRLSDIANVSERSKAGQTHTFITDPKNPTRRAVQFFVFKNKNADINKSFKAVEPVVRDFVAKYDGRFTLYSIENTSDLIDKQFGDLYTEFSNTSILVFILLLIFLGLRQGIISNVTVPLTFLGTFAVMSAMGLTLNFLTVFSLLLTLGILIDDTIVVVAAMTRYYKTGKFTPFETGVMVWRDFITPLWSSAITTVWGFVPLLLATGIIGEFIKSIPIVVTTTMILSTVISTFITIPLMIILLKPEFPKRVKSMFTFIGVLAYVGLFVSTAPKNVLLLPILAAAVVALIIGYRTRKSLAQSWNVYLKRNKKLARFVNRAGTISEHGLINVEGLSNGYRKVIEGILRSEKARKQTVWAIAIFTIVAYMLLPLGLVKNEFFPKDNQDLLYVGVDLPSGTNNALVTAETIRLGNELKGTPELDFLVAEVGYVFLSTGSRQADPDAILYTLHLTKHEDRKLTSGDIAEKVREKFAGYSAGTLSVVELSGGPPAGADVQIQLLGDELGTLDEYADKIIAFLKKSDGVVNVDKSIKSGTSKVVFVPDRAKIVAQGLSVDQVALALRTYASGFTLDSIRFGKDEQDIIFRTNDYDTKPIDSLSTIEIALNGRDGGSVPLSALGTFKLETNPTVITRENEKRTISIFGGVTAGVNIPEKNAQLLKYADSLTLPDGYEWKTGGVNEENEKSVASILNAMGLAFLLILVTMVIEFGSFRQAFIAMLMIPISVAGVFYIFALIRTPLSFAALIGVLALFGIVMRHAIVVMEKINENRHHGMNLHDSIADACSSRLEPVLLTSLATIVALIPITISDPFWRGLGGAIIAGLLFTGALKLFIVPVLYYNFFKDEK
jgi:multidrug efflux pump subunit AcrB